jgi:hypothetical protein
MINEDLNQSPVFDKIKLDPLLRQTLCCAPQSVVIRQLDSILARFRLDLCLQGLYLGVSSSPLPLSAVNNQREHGALALDCFVWAHLGLKLLNQS